MLSEPLCPQTYGVFRNRVNLDLSDTIVRDIIDIEPYGYDIKIGSLNMSGMRLIGKMYIDWEINQCKKLIVNQRRNKQ